jgi:addiction module HigA family antidote
MTKNGFPSIHPGEFLAEILEDLGMSQAEFARAIDVSPMRISHVIKGLRPITAEPRIRIYGSSRTPKPSTEMLANRGSPYTDERSAIRRMVATAFGG